MTIDEYLALDTEQLRAFQEREEESLVFALKLEGLLLATLDEVEEEEALRAFAVKLIEAMDTSTSIQALSALGALD